MPISLIFLCCLTLCSFAANSILCRLALSDSANSPVSFTIARLGSGAIMLAWILWRHKPSAPPKKFGPYWAALALFSYALFFSLAYVRLSAGTGALILFASVQLTMMITAFANGHRMNRREAAGFLLALGGFVYLVLPGVGMPPPAAATAMALAGLSWGYYSLLGLGAADPAYNTARNFALTTPLLLALAWIYPVQLTRQGLGLALLSGAVTSGLGYVLWYRVLKSLSASTAAMLQFSVPALAALGGALLLGETIHARLLIATALIVGGIVLKISTPKK